MSDMRIALDNIMAATPHKLVLSNPAPASLFRRININLGNKGYFIEKLTKTQAFHESVGVEALGGYLGALLGTDFSQLHAWDKDGAEHALRVAKSGKILTNVRKGAVKAAPVAAHDRQKRHILPEGADVPVLKDMGIFTADGAVAAGMGDKFRQINRFLEFIDDVYRGGAPDPVRVVDFGCGKSYLTFLVYHYFTQIRKVRARILGLDLKEDVIRACQASAARYGYEGLTFRRGDIAAHTDFDADLLITLHACDTATDHALFNAVHNNVPVILAAPCCQHEINAQMRPGALGIFSRHGIIKERAAALLTDAIRANLLTHAGYKTQILEFIDLAHTPKNLLIRAVKANIPAANRKLAYDEVVAAVRELGSEPTLLRLMAGAET